MSYAIRRIQNFYGPRVVKSYVTDGYNNETRAEFATRAEAEAVVEQMDDALYCTAHNESGRAEYRVVRIRP